MEAKTILRAIFDEFLKEVRSNHDLEDRIAKIIAIKPNGPQKPAKSRHRRMPGAFDPMLVYRESPDSLKPRLEALELDQLKDIVAENGMDRSKLAMKWKSKPRLIDLIFSTIESRAQKGDAFRKQKVDQDPGDDTSQGS